MWGEQLLLFAAYKLRYCWRKLTNCWLDNPVVVLMCIIAANCSIEVLAYGSNTEGIPRYGYVKLNTVPVWQASWGGIFPNLRGVNTLLVDPFNCSLQEWHQFDTWGDPSAGAVLNNYLQQVKDGRILVGVTADEPTRYLGYALATLREMGADVSDVQGRGSFGFVAQKGFPEKTVLRKALTEEESFVNQPRFNVTVTGRYKLLWKMTPCQHA